MSQSRKYEQIQQGRGQQTAQNRHRHGAFDLLARAIHTDRQRRKSERGDRRRHENGDQALIRAADHHGETPRRALHFDQMLVMGELQDRVARADPEYGHQARPPFPTKSRCR